jgi:hypothetical protein
MVRTPQQTYQALTKRPERMAWALGPEGIGFYAAEAPVPCPQPNIWLGTSIENRRWVGSPSPTRTTRQLTPPGAGTGQAWRRGFPLATPLHIRESQQHSDSLRVLPGGIFDYVEGVIRWSNRVVAYAFILVTDEYPPFSLRP